MATTGKPAVEQRKLGRSPVALKVEYKFDSTIRQSLTRDLSEGGMFLVTDKPAVVGTKVYLRVETRPGLPLIKIIGTVRRKVEAAETASPGMGIEFEVIYAQDSQALKSFLNEQMGRSVADSAIHAVAQTKTYKHVLKNGARAEPPPPATAKKAATARRPPARKQKSEDEIALARLNFSYNKWVLERVLKFAGGALVPVGLYLLVKFILKLADQIYTN